MKEDSGEVLGKKDTFFLKQFFANGGPISGATVGIAARREAGFWVVGGAMLLTAAVRAGALALCLFIAAQSAHAISDVSASPSFVTSAPSALSDSPSRKEIESAITLLRACRSADEKLRIARARMLIAATVSDFEEAKRDASNGEAAYRSCIAQYNQADTSRVSITPATRRIVEGYFHEDKNQIARTYATSDRVREGCPGCSLRIQIY